jgi:hypothetical protein
MCIIVISETKPLELASFEDFAKYNQDGAGIMVARGGKVHTHVTLGGPKEVYAKYLELYRKGDPMFLHYRMKTHGAIDLANTHPYLVYRHADGKELWMMHNGVLRTGNTASPEMSDTWNFIQQRLQTLTRDYPKWFMNDDLVQWLGDFIGNNRFVFLDSDGDFNVVNESQWSTHDEHLYSNEYAWSAPRKAYKTTYPKYLPQSRPQYQSARETEAEDWWGQGAAVVNPHGAGETEADKAAAAYDFYNLYATEINAALPAGAIKGWTPQIVVQLEEYISLDWFVDFLDSKTYSAEECDALMRVLDVEATATLTQEAEELVDGILYSDNTTLETTTTEAVDTPAAHASTGVHLKVLN